MSSLSSFQVHHNINTTSNARPGRGIIFKKDTTSQLIKGHNQVWYRQSRSSANQLCLMGKGSIVQQKTMSLSARYDDSEEESIINQHYLSGSYH